MAHAHHSPADSSAHGHTDAAAPVVSRPGHAPGHQHDSGHRHGSDHEHGHGHGHGSGSGHGHGFSHDLTEMLDLDGEVVAGALTGFVSRVAALAGSRPVRDVVDLGAGTGTGSFALLRHFPEATVTAVDASPDMLDHLLRNAHRLGFDGRIRPHQADLDAGWPETGPADLVWASSALHHMTDPDRVLTDIRGTLRPGGLLALIEMNAVPRFLPDDIGIGRPGLEDRCHAIADRSRAEHLPHQGSDWASRLSGSGFTILEARELVLDSPAPLSEPAVRYAVATLRRFRAGVADGLSADDRQTFDTLLADDARLLRALPGLTMRSTRSTWIATPS